MKRIWHLCALAVLSLSLILAIIGCGQLSQETDYTIVNGKEQKCTQPTAYSDVGKGKFCSFPFYARLSFTDGTTKNSECDTFTSGQFGPGLECSEVTPNASNSQSTAQIQCKPNWTYDNLVDNGIAWKVVVKQNDVNGTAAPEQANVAVTTSKTVTVSDSAKLTASTSLEAGVDVYVGVDISASMTASVKAEINHSVTETVVVAVGNSIIITVPPHETGYSIYGVRVQVVSGHLHDTNTCEGSKSDAGTDISYVPIDAEWCTWISNTPDPCPVVSD